MSARQTKPQTIRPRLAYRALAEDPVFGPWVRHIGPPRMGRSTLEPFSYLVRSIVFQQLAGKAATTIHGRVVAALGGRVTPQRLQRTPDATLQAAGLSRNKLAAIRDLAGKQRRLQLDQLARLPDEEVIERLVTVRGIGPWTAQMFLMFALQRSDVWPIGDLGVRSGYAKLHGLDETPRERDMASLGDAYRPWRSVAAWYCWQVLDTELP